MLDDNSIDFKDKEYARMMAEFALLSFMKIQAKINREPLILEYRKDPRLNQRMANYKVKFLLIYYLLLDLIFKQNNSNGFFVIFL